MSILSSWLARLDGLLVRSGLRRNEPPEEGVARVSAGTMRLYVAIVVFPVILYATFVYLIRSPGYVSEAFIVVQQDPSLSAPTLDFGLLSGPSTGAIDALLIQAYIESRALLEDLDRDLKLREHYSDPQRDVFSRLWQISRPWGPASRESFLLFYQSRVNVVIDTDSLIIHLSVEAYDREYAKRLADSIVERATTFVNGISQAAARDQMAFVETELEKSNQRLRAASEQLLVLQKKNTLLSPEAETATLSNIIASMQADLAGRRSQLTAMRSYLNDSAPEIVAQRNGIAALERQIEQERRKQTGPGASTGDKAAGLTDLFLEYQAAQTAVTVATDSYRSGLTTLEAARLEASRSAKRLVEVSAPSLPDESLVPQRLFSTVTAFFLLNAAFFILTLVAAAIRDHRDA